ncbi:MULTISPECIES: hypothetical protein [unclassified Streptomyces]|uniref:hypothetical protein n=1 Tax=unclassified Streptomyces TaxID=2593676 RepID=UPI0033BCD19F
MNRPDDAGTERTPALRMGSGHADPLAELLTQACHTVLDGHIGVVGAALAGATQTLLTAGDDGQPQPVVQMAASAAPACRARHIALADIRGWSPYYVESARITLRLTIPAPPGPDGVLRTTPATADAASTMTATIRLSTRPGPPLLADDLIAAALAPAPPSLDNDRFSAPARQAITAWRHLPNLYRCTGQLSDEATDHPATTTALQAAENLAAAVCTWCAGGPPVDTRLLIHAPHPENLDPDAPPALVALATTVTELHHALHSPERD